MTRYTRHPKMAYDLGANLKIFLIKKKRYKIMKKNIGAQLALYPCPVIVVGAIVKGKATWTLVAHAGTVRILL